MTRSEIEIGNEFNDILDPKVIEFDKKTRTEDKKILEMQTKIKEVNTSLCFAKIENCINYLADQKSIINNQKDILLQKENLKLTLNELITAFQSTATSITFYIEDYKLGGVVETGFCNLTIDKKNYLNKELEIDEILKLSALSERLETIKDIADPNTKRKINALLKSQNINVELVIQKVKEIENNIDYMLIHESKTLNNISNTLGKFDKKKKCIVDIYTGSGKIKTDDLEYEINNFSKLKENISISTSKLLIYAIDRLTFNENISKFTFTEYAEARNIDKQQNNRIKLQKDLKILDQIGSIKYTNTKNDTMILDHLIYSASYKAGNVFIKFNPEFVQGLKDTYMYFPKSLMKLNGKEFKNVFLLGWYLFVQLRINCIDKLTRSIAKCLEQLSLPKLEEVKNSDYQNQIIKPFENIIDTLNEKVPELNITFKDDYITIKEFLDGTIEIEFTNELINKKYAVIDLDKKKKSIKYNKAKRTENIKICQEYLKSGKNKKDIAKIMNKTIRTIELYIKEINAKK